VICAATQLESHESYAPALTGSGHLRPVHHGPACRSRRGRSAQVQHLPIVCCRRRRPRRQQSPEPQVAGNDETYSQHLERRTAEAMARHLDAAQCDTISLVYDMSAACSVLHQA
jgi:hypothetical protein